MQQSFDIWDKMQTRRRLKPGAPAAQEARGATQPKQPRPRDEYDSPELPPGPEWSRRERMKMNRTAPGPYETGERDIDDFNRKRNLGGPDQDDPNPDAYRDPREFDRGIRGAYHAGRNGDTNALNSFPNTPYGQLQRRAYNEGVRDARRQRGRQ